MNVSIVLTGDSFGLLSIFDRCHCGSDCICVVCDWSKKVALIFRIPERGY